MIVYNPKDWFYSTFYLHRSDTARKLFPLLLALSVYSGGIAYVELEYVKLSDVAWVKNITIVHNLLGFVMSILLVFRTNTAYDRWGTLTNSSCSFAIKMSAFLNRDDQVNRSFYIKSIPLFADTLFAHLRSSKTQFMLDSIEHPEFETLDAKKHGPNQVASMIVARTNSLYKEGLISGDQLIVINNEISSFTDVCGACERIKNTPIPLSYSSFIKKFIFIYVLTLPIGFVFSMGYFVIAAVPFIFYVMASLELIAESIEDPFGTDPDDLPIDKIGENIRTHVMEILH